MNWSPQQQAIFDWFERPNALHPNLVVRARAGTGKTTTILEAVKKAPEPKILICAFSKTIQTELQARIGSAPNIMARTLHSVGLACVSRFRERIKVEYGNGRADALAEQACRPQPIPQGKRYNDLTQDERMDVTAAPDAIVRLVSKLHTKGRLMAPHAREVGDLTDIAIAFECEPDETWEDVGFDLHYVERKALLAMELASQVQAGGTIDGSDMIFLPVRNRWLTKQFNLVVVDEAQDMTTAQLEIAQGVLKPGGRIAIVGDNRQAIFGFIGADCHSLDRLKQELNAVEMGLTVTYRCGRSIVNLAQEFVPDFEAGPDNPEGMISKISIEALTNAAGPGDFIISRVNAPLVSIAMKLLRNGKRTRIAGRDIGAGLRALVKKMKASSVPMFLAKVEAWSIREETRLKAQLAQAPKARKASINAKIDAVLDQAAMLVALTEGAKSVSEIETRIEHLFSDDGLGAAGMITCSSVHKAKGLEAHRVFILRSTLRQDSEEEQNISYVAITRAKQELVWVGSASQA